MLFSKGMTGRSCSAVMRLIIILFQGQEFAQLVLPIHRLRTVCKSRSWPRASIQIKELAPGIHSHQVVGPGHPFTPRSWPLAFIHTKQLAPGIHSHQGVGLWHPFKSRSWHRHQFKSRSWHGASTFLYTPLYISSFLYIIIAIFFLSGDGGGVEIRGYGVQFWLKQIIFVSRR